MKAIQLRLKLSGTEREIKERIKERKKFTLYLFWIVFSLIFVLGSHYLLGLSPNYNNHLALTQPFLLYFLILILSLISLIASISMLLREKKENLPKLPLK